MAATYDCIATATLTSTSTSVVFSNIPQTYTDLIVVFTGSNTVATVAMTCEVDINDDGANNYSSTRLNTTAVSSRGTNNNGGFVGATGRNSADGWYVCNFMNYSNSTTYKTWLSVWGVMGDTEPDAGRIVGMWRNTSAITKLDFNRPVGQSGTFEVGCRWALYGIKAA